MVTVLRGGLVVTPRGPLPDQDVVIDAGHIAAISERRRLAAGNEIIDVAGSWVVPGLVDIHVHGGDGFDTLDGTPEALHGMARFLARHGVTSFIATTITSSRQAIDAAVAAAALISATPGGARLRGLHLEGPYLAAAQAGAQPLGALRNPDPAEYAAWFASGVVKRITIAPELEGAGALIDRAQASGVRVSLGHTAASTDEARRVFDQGVNQCTHIFNGVPGLDHQKPGVLAACLEDSRVFAEAIVDGIHIHPDIVRLLVRWKGADRVMLVSDAIRATGHGDGIYDLGGTRVEVRDGITRRPHDGGLAGSTLTLDRALRNVMAFAGLTLAQALPMATTVPARAMGWEAGSCSIEVGRVADLVVLDRELSVRMTLVGGTTVHDGRESAVQVRHEGGDRD